MNYNISNDLICRLCLMDNGGSVSVFSTNTYDCRSGVIGLAQKVMQIANVQMYEGDGLPILICRVCLNRVEGFFQFKIQVEKSDFILRQQICQYEDNCVAHVPNEKQSEDVKTESMPVLKSSSTVYVTDNTWVDSVQSFAPLQHCGTLENTVSISTPQEVSDVLADDSHQTAFVNFRTEDIEEDKSLLDLSQQEGKTLEHPSGITDIYQQSQCNNETGGLSGKNAEDQGKESGNYYDHNNDFFDQTSGLDLKMPAPSSNALPECDRYENTGASSENKGSDNPENKIQSSEDQVINYCEECDQHFEEPIGLIKHKYLHPKALKCTFCDKSFKQSCQLKSHIRTHTGERPYSCLVCPKTFIDKSALSSHSRLAHFTEKTHACSHCNKTFKLKKQLERHQRIHTGHQYHRCEICSKLFTQKSNLVKHLILHSGAKPYSCKFCDQPFAQKDNLNTHIFRHHSEQDPVSCDLCGKTFKNKMTLTGHKKKKHTGNNAKLIICEICGKCFQDRSCLNSHKWVHSPGEPIECDVCGKTYPHLRAVRVHKRVVHSEVRKHCCDVCGIGFKTSQTLKHHKVVHTGERAFSCEECGRCFGQKTALTTHYRIHNGVEPYSCPRCGVSFKWKQTCDKHIIKCTGKPNHGFMITSVSDNPAVT